MSIAELSEQELIRRNSMQKLVDMGIDPYPAAEFPVNTKQSKYKNSLSQRRTIFRML
jgi:lysyl-tRNA synthetase class 2